MDTVSCDLKEQIEWSETQVDMDNPSTSKVLAKVAEFKSQHKEVADDIITNNRWRYTDINEWSKQNPNNRWDKMMRDNNK